MRQLDVRVSRLEEDRGRRRPCCQRCWTRLVQEGHSECTRNSKPIVVDVAVIVSLNGNRRADRLHQHNCGGIAEHDPTQLIVSAEEGCFCGPFVDHDATSQRTGCEEGGRRCSPNPCDTHGVRRSFLKKERENTLATRTKSRAVPSLNRCVPLHAHANALTNFSMLPFPPSCMNKTSIPHCPR